MVDSTRLFVFLGAAILLAIAPGPGMLYVLARTLAGGRREGLLSALGTFFGGMVHVFAAAAGVSIILAKSAVAFATVKYLGAGYLCFLGVRMILDARKKDEGISLAGPPRERNPSGRKAATNTRRRRSSRWHVTPVSAVRHSGSIKSGRLRRICSPRNK